MLQLFKNWTAAIPVKKILIGLIALACIAYACQLVHRFRSNLQGDIIELKTGIKQIKDQVAAGNKRVAERDLSIQKDSIIIERMAATNVALVRQSESLRSAIVQVKVQHEKDIIRYSNLAIDDRLREFATVFPDSIK